MTDGARRAAFLDRDGVINLDAGYTHRPADLALTPTAAAGIRRLNGAGWLAIVVTNQSGVARGLYTEADVHAFHAHLATTLAAEGARIDAFYHCPFHPDGTVAAYAREHEDRKPGPGMILRAMREHGIGRDGSFLVGDRESDLLAAAAAGIPGVLVAPNEGCDLLAAVEARLPPAPARAA